MRRTASAGDEKACGQNDVCQKNMADHQEGDVCFGRQSAFFEQGRPTRNKRQDGRNQRRKQQQMNRRRHRQEKPVATGKTSSAVRTEIPKQAARGII